MPDPMPPAATDAIRVMTVDGAPVGPTTYGLIQAATAGAVVSTLAHLTGLTVPQVVDQLNGDTDQVRRLLDHAEECAVMFAGEGTELVTSLTIGDPA